MIQEIQDKLNRYCLINRKYQLLDESQFLSEFPNIESEYLKKAWKYSLDKIQNYEVIKDAKELPTGGEKIISNRLHRFNFNSSDLYYYLNSKFDVKELKHEDEIIERRLRITLAVRHQNILSSEINNLKRRQKLNEIKDKIVSGFKVIIIPLLIIGFLFGSRIRDGFTSVDVLTERIYEREIYEFNGSVCRDGWISNSQGRGTCSWHNGVRFKFYKGQHKYSKKECREMAKQRSWIE